MGSIKEFDQKVNTEGCFFEDFGCISSIRNYLRKVKVMLENRNADKWTKACETIIKAPKRSTNFLWRPYWRSQLTFYDVLTGEAN